MLPHRLLYRTQTIMVSRNVMNNLCDAVRDFYNNGKITKSEVFYKDNNSLTKHNFNKA